MTERLFLTVFGFCLSPPPQPAFGDAGRPGHIAVSTSIRFSTGVLTRMLASGVTEEDMARARRPR